ncbi:hypothetical protein J6590_054712 [Homalodisca vitripennis]|nr:hypothetical protein J6590_054712 [Homalodisca vitripennis]
MERCLFERRGRSPFKPYSVRPHGLCKDLIKQDKEEIRYNKKVDGTGTKCYGHRQDLNLRYLSDLKFDVFDRSAIGTLNDVDPKIKARTQSTMSREGEDFRMEAENQMASLNRIAVS